MQNAKANIVFDCEIYCDYFLCAFRDAATGQVQNFEMFEGQPFDAAAVREILRSNKLFGFNSANFDLPLLTMALAGKSCAEIKHAANLIIVKNMRSWQIEKKYAFKTLTNVDHVDLIEVAPGVASLKVYGGRLHCPKMQDLPIEPDASINAAQRQELAAYCGNDLFVTQMLADKLAPQIALRESMSKQYGMDLRSKSDAQIAEAVIKSEVEKITNDPLARPEVDTGTEYIYTPPAYIGFQSPALREVMAKLKTSPFIVQDTGKVDMPDWLKKQAIEIGSAKYKMGVGGLHSTESSVSHRDLQGELLIERDVASYYPNIILTLGLAPRHMGRAFSKVYRSIVNRRLAAKASGDKVTNEVLKIVINGSFGKLGSKWSILYAPDLMMAVTMTGQLALLMLIERIELAGIPVVSANTDGVVVRCPHARKAELDDIFMEWEIATGFETEEAEYAALYSKDVNNYIAVKKDGKVKAKGVYAAGGLAKTPSNRICVEAVVEYLTRGTPVEETVHGCWDTSKFVTVRSVKGGALDQQGEYLGKAVRFYYAQELEGPLTYKVNGYMVPRTEGAKALMQLTDQPPADLDLDWYTAEANRILKDIGATA